MTLTEPRERFNDRPIYTLSEIGKSLQSIIEKNYNRAYYIKAEIIKLNYYPRTGHCYPELAEKENETIKAQMRAIIWSSAYRAINERFKKITGETLKEGLTILCLATIEFSPQYGLALHIQDIEPTFTLGEMAKNKQAVIDKLKKEKLFDANKKTTLPMVPKRIAVISVETSKGYSDFMITLSKNNWNYKFECQLFPSLLQGEKAITNMVERLAQIKEKIEDFDCVAIIRGGGGDVGLSCYDHYTLANEVARFPIPILTGIGHSTNETVTEMVAFANKITPTAVAYFLIQQYHNFALLIEDYQNSILTKASERIKNDFFILEKQNQILILLAKQLLNQQKERLQHYEKQLELLHPDKILKRGFSITYLNGKIITDSQKLKENDTITTHYFKGKSESIIKKST